MSYTFNGSARKIILSSGTTSVDVEDLYSRWVDWVRSSGAGYLQAFRVEGGAPDGRGGFTGKYVFTMNGWQIVPQSADHTLTIDGNIFRDPDDTSALPLVTTVPGYTVLVFFTVSSLAQGISTDGSGGGSTLTPAQIWQYGDRTLTSGANLVLAKGTHITGFNDLSLAAIEASTVLAKQTTVLSVQAALASVPTNPLLTNDSRLNNLGTIDTIYSLLGFKPGDSLTASQTQHTTASGKRLLISVSGDGTTTLTRSDP